MSFDKLRSTMEARPIGGTFYMKATEVAPLLERHDALLERVTVLERALEEADGWTQSGNSPYYALGRIHAIAQEAING